MPVRGEHKAQPTLPGRWVYPQNLCITLWRSSATHRRDVVPKRFRLVWSKNDQQPRADVFQWVAGDYGAFSRKTTRNTLVSMWPTARVYKFRLETTRRPRQPTDSSGVRSNGVAPSRGGSRGSFRRASTRRPCAAMSDRRRQGRSRSRRCRSARARSCRPTNPMRSAAPGLRRASSATSTQWKRALRSSVGSAIERARASRCSRRRRRARRRSAPSVRRVRRRARRRRAPNRRRSRAGRGAGSVPRFQQRVLDERGFRFGRSADAELGLGGHAESEARLGKQRAELDDLAAIAGREHPMRRRRHRPRTAACAASSCSTPTAARSSSTSSSLRMNAWPSAVPCTSMKPFASFMTTFMSVSASESSA